jgi:hypothetical protein
MKTLSLLGSICCAAVIAGTGTSQAIDTEKAAPIVIVDEGQIEGLGNKNVLDLLYLAPSLSVFSGSAYAPEFGGGLKWRGVGDPRLNLSIEGSAALYQPGSVGELWVGSRIGFTLDDISKIEVVSSGAAGLIGGTPSYRAGLGIELPVLSNTDVFVEGVLGGHIGSSPTDNGIRAGFHFFPARAGEFFDPGFRNPPSITDLPVAPYIGTSFTVVPSGGGIVIPAVDFGANFPLENGIVPGVRGQVGFQLPASVLEGWAGGQLGFQATPQVQPYVFGELGLIGNFPANRAGVGFEINLGKTWTINPEFAARGGIGAFSEITFKLGARWQMNAAANMGQRYRW